MTIASGTPVVRAHDLRKAWVLRQDELERGSAMANLAMRLRTSCTRGF
jgi:hypothetical protein